MANPEEEINLADYTSSEDTIERNIRLVKEKDAQIQREHEEQQRDLQQTIKDYEARIRQLEDEEKKDLEKDTAQQQAALHIDFIDNTIWRIIVAGPGQVLSWFLIYAVIVIIDITLSGGGGGDEVMGELGELVQEAGVVEVEEGPGGGDKAAADSGGRRLQQEQQMLEMPRQFTYYTYFGRRMVATTGVGSTGSLNLYSIYDYIR